MPQHRKARVVSSPIVRATGARASCGAGFDMTDTEINIAIAEACGWERETVHSDLGNRNFEAWKKDGRRLVTQMALPDYVGDLNAMHGAEVELENEIATADQYWTELAELTMADDEELSTCTRYRYIGNATARQRAEAFLRVKGLWK